MLLSNWDHGGISCDVHFAGQVEQTSEVIRVTYKICSAVALED